MAKATDFILILYPLLISALVLNSHCLEKKIHIVYMGERLEAGADYVSMHHSMLQTVLGSVSSARESIVHSYGRSFNGFAAKLSDEEVQTFAEMEEVVSVMPNEILELHTTRSWDFMGFGQNNFGGGNEGDVIVGLIDTGVWPEAASFNDDGFSPPPAKWKGTCQGDNFTCNYKLIGARYYNSQNVYGASEPKSPRDYFGHGTHTASTAAGREVSASYFGLAGGLARGGVPNARVAVYKVCWVNAGCTSADILAAFDDAIADGVDIISVSLGSRVHNPFFKDTIAIGSFHAMKHGILTSNSAGNSGPYPLTVINYSPWSLTVAASTIDRKFVAQAVLGNGQVFNGLSINNFELNGASFPLIWGGDAANFSNGANPQLASQCYRGSLNSLKVRGKIVLCSNTIFAGDVMSSGGMGTIIALTDSSFTNVAFNYPVPATQISSEDGLQILDYIRSTKNPTATILIGKTLNDTTAATIAAFSSRGPNYLIPDILKPDITAPGVDILAAWSPISPPAGRDQDTRSAKYNIISGTSMSCPHAAAAAAYVKAAHPDWSPAAIKSALMTTAYVMNSKNQVDLEFAYGSGHINPVKAVTPGLVYDASEADYVNLLCRQGYNATALRLVTGDDSSCNGTGPGKVWDFNYPTFALSIEDGQKIYGEFTRTVTNVGSPNSTYTASMYMPAAFSATIEPSVLTFSYVGEKKTFQVKVYGPEITQQPIMSGAIMWSDGVHVVRSPLVVFNIIPGGYATSMSAATQKESAFTGSSIYHRNNIIGGKY